MGAVTGAWSWLLAPAVEVAGVPTSRLEVLAFVSGALCVWLVVRQNPWNWPIGIVNAAAFLALFATSGLYADASLQGVYIALGLFGWWQWVFGGPVRNELPVTRTTPRQWAGLGLASAVATAVIWWALATFSTSTVPGPDSVTTVLSLAATWGQCLKKVESWWLWIAADVIYVPLYASKGLWLTAGLYGAFLVLCVLGLRAWRRDVEAGDGGRAVPALAVP